MNDAPLEIMRTTYRDTLIIFAKQPVPGRVKTRLSPPLSTHEAAELYRCMLADVLTKAESLGSLEKELWYEPSPGAAAWFARTAPGMPSHPQRGGDLGERMEEAFSHAFAGGADTAAIIGTDSPDLPLACIESAYEWLREPDVDAVFGPAGDGGYYLLGMKRVHGELFRDVPWSSGDVLQRSLEHAACAGIRVRLLPMWHDIDLPDDLARPELLAERNGAFRTREFIARWLKRVE